MASGVLGTLKYIIGAKTTDLERGLKKSEGQVNSFSRNIQSGVTKAMTKVGGAIAAAFAVDRIKSFISESVKLAAQAEGVEAAFSRLNQPGLLKNLRTATRGTIDDLTLMQQAVKAQNFKLPLQQLGTFFEFATKRAAQTGESVDYLVNSIVLGIGRKSPLILDNLGISAVELRKRLKGVGIEAASVADVSKIMGDIIAEEMDAMGEVALTTAQKMQQVSAELANTKAEFGELITPFTVTLLEEANYQLDQTNKTLKDFNRGDAALGFERLATVIAGYLNPAYADFYKAQRQAKDAAGDTSSVFDKWGTTLMKMLNPALSGTIDLQYEASQILEETEKTTKKATDATEKNADAVEDAAKTTENWESKLKTLNQEIEKAAQLINDDLNASIARIGREGTGDLLGGTKIAIGDFAVDPEGMQSFDEDIMGIDDSVNQNLLPSLTTFEDRMNNIQVLGGLLSNIFDDMAAEDPFAAMIESIKGLIAQLAQAAALSLILSLVTGGISNFGKIFGGMTGFSFPGKGVQKYAEGGITNGPALAMVGDNPSGKEAIIPLEKMGQIFGGMQGGGMGGGRLTATVSGTDLKFVLDRTNQDFNRFN